ncbi:MAG: 3'(2'),5'-bisphosphate nucleotidase [Deltaproteobacteria bacterium]|nr:3'(2'),5'-bisphosphate nucleotidase [Deltaproteobacteria bacterium]
MNSRDLELALHAVARASLGVNRVRNSLVTVESIQKKDKSPVTVADFTAQAIVASTLAEALPNDPLVGEESSKELEAAGPVHAESVRSHVNGVLGTAFGRGEISALIDRGGGSPNASRFWTLDPIDGTKGFLRGEQFAVALALIEDGRVTLGVLGCPNLDDGKGVVVAAARGEGARAYPLSGLGSGAPIHVARVDQTDRIRFTESVESGHSDQTQSAEIARLLGITAPPVRMDSQVKYATVARGDAAIYLRLPTRADYQEWIWDHAAGSIVVEEAGGRLTDVKGQPLDFSCGRKLSANVGVVATNSALHDRVLEAVARVLG